MQNSDLVKKTSQLANLQTTSAEEKELITAFAVTLEVMDQLQTVDVSQVEPTSRIGNDVNRWREDEIDEKRMFTQKQALANTHGKTHRGFFVVERLIDHEA